MLASATIIVIVLALRWLSRRPRLRGFFRFCPLILCVFLVPAILVAVGALPSGTAEHAKVLIKWLLPAAVVQYTVSTDLRLLRSLGARPFYCVITGGLTVVVSGAISFALAAHLFDPSSWKQIAPLVGGWVGGYGTMMAVKEGVRCPDDAFAPVLLIGSVLAYTWMAFLAGLASQQDRLNQVLFRVEEDDESTSDVDLAAGNRGRLSLLPICLTLAAGVIAGFAAMQLGDALPPIEPVMTGTTWGFVVILVAGLMVSLLRPIREVFQRGLAGADFLLLVVVAAYGSRCPITALPSAAGFIPIGLMVLAVHATALVLFGRLLRVPLAVLAIASQANIGGVASAPIVANAYRPGLESLGVVMGLLAGLLGLPLGLAAAALMSQLSKIV